MPDSTNDLYATFITRTVSDVLGALLSPHEMSWTVIVHDASGSAIFFVSSGPNGNTKTVLNVLARTCDMVVADATTSSVN